MNFREFVEQCTKLLNDQPEIGNAMVIASADDEGNEYREVFYTPSIGYYDDSSTEFYTEESYTYLFEDEEDSQPFVANSVCIN